MTVSILHQWKKLITICILAMGVFSHCSLAQVHDPWGVSTYQLDKSLTREPVFLANGVEKDCKPVYSKRIVNFLFVVPLNSDQDLLQESGKTWDGKTVRFRRVMYPWDIVLTTLGGAISFVTHSVVLEECQSQEQIQLTRKDLEMVAERKKLGDSPAWIQESSDNPVTQEQEKHLVFFHYNDSKLEEKESEKLHQFASSVPIDKSRVRFLVIGHSSEEGEIESNLKLAWERALSVRTKLLESGIEPDHISVSASSESLPHSISANQVEAESTQDWMRSAEIFLLVQSAQ